MIKVLIRLHVYADCMYMQTACICRLHVYADWSQWSAHVMKSDIQISCDIAYIIMIIYF